MRFPIVPSNFQSPHFRLLFCHGLGSKADAQLVLEWTKSKPGKCLQFKMIKYSGYGQGIDRPWRVDDWAHDITSELQSEHPTIAICFSASAQALLRAIWQDRSLLQSMIGLMMVSPGVGMEVNNYIQRVLPTKDDELKAGMVVEHPSIDPAIKIGINLASLNNYQRNCILRRRQPMPFSLGFPVRIVHGIYDKLVPFKNSIELLEMIEAKNKALFLVNSGHFIRERSTLIHALDSIWDEILQERRAAEQFHLIG